MESPLTQNSDIHTKLLPPSEFMGIRLTVRRNNHQNKKRRAADILLLSVSLNCRGTVLFNFEKTLQYCCREYEFLDFSAEIDGDIRLVQRLDNTGTESLMRQL